MPGGPRDWSYEKVKAVTFVDDIINETLRLKPALLTGGYRVTPAKGIQVDEVYVPGNVNVFVPAQLIHTDSRYWTEPLEFIPERWGEKKEEMETENAPFIPFALGQSACARRVTILAFVVANGLDQVHIVVQGRTLLK